MMAIPVMTIIVAIIMLVAGLVVPVRMTAAGVRRVVVVIVMFNAVHRLAVAMAATIFVCSVVGSRLGNALADHCANGTSDAAADDGTASAGHRVADQGAGDGTDATADCDA